MTRVLSIATVSGLAVLAFILVESTANGCAAVPRLDRRDSPIVITEEGAVIIWDSVNKVEHFIRRAAFDTPSPDFAFLVPTPGVPTLTEMEDEVFRLADAWIQPRTVEKTQFKFNVLMGVFCCVLGADSRRAAMEPKSNVRILAEQKVGGFETKVLEADKTDALSDWLKSNGYSNDPELQSWLFPYVAAKWKITAFKIMQDPQTGKLATTKPVRMSFKTDKPFFPYREPEGKLEAKKDDKPKEIHFDDKGDRVRNNGRLLRVYFISDVRMKGTLGHAAWHATVPWADQLTDDQRTQVVAETGLKDGELPAKVWMTTFEDRASPRPGKEDVYFAPAQDQSPVRPRDFIHYNMIWIPIDCILFVVVLVAIVGGVIYGRRHRVA